MRRLKKNGRAMMNRRSPKKNNDLAAGSIKLDRGGGRLEFLGLVLEKVSIRQTADKFLPVYR